MNYNQDETFRRLSRKPLKEVYSKIYSTAGRIKASDKISFRKQFEEIVNSFGYTMEEFNDFESKI